MLLGQTKEWRLLDQDLWPWTYLPGNQTQQKNLLTVFQTSGVRWGASVCGAPPALVEEAPYTTPRKQRNHQDIQLLPTLLWCSHNHSGIIHVYKETDGRGWNELKALAILFCHSPSQNKVLTQEDYIATSWLSLMHLRKNCGSSGSGYISGLCQPTVDHYCVVCFHSTGGQDNVCWCFYL